MRRVEVSSGAECAIACPAPCTLDPQVRQARRAEERATRAAEKAAKEERKKQEDMKSYKHIMKVRIRFRPILHCRCIYQIEVARMVHTLFASCR